MENEFQVVWERILPIDILSSIAPILMCPDDLDFSCSLVVAKVQITDQTVIWEKIGFDNTNESVINPNTVGQEVIWFDTVNEFQFNLNQYMECINTFRFENEDQ
jgi:hypothetical protein